MSIFVRKNKKASPAGRSKPKKGAQKTSFIRDTRFPKLIGATLVLMGTFVLVAGISYVFTWKIDQDKILNYPFSALGEGELIVENWLGRLGAVVGNALIYWGFGITALVLPVLVIGFGLRKLVGAGLETWYSRAGRSVLTMVYCSMLFGFLFSSSNFPWGGAFGESTTMWLSGFMGMMGVALALFFILFATAIIQFNPSFNVKGEFLKMPDVKMPDWKLSPSELGLDFFRKKIHASPDGSLTEDDEEETEEEEVVEKEGSLRPGFLDMFLKKHSKTKEEIVPLDDEDDIDSLELTMDEEEEEEEEEIMEDDDPMDPELEITGLPDTTEIAEAFSESHVPSTFSGVQDKVFLMDQENNDHSEPYDPTLELSSYVPPELELLLEYPDEKITIDRAEVEANKDQIIETLLNYKIEITKIRATIGPTVTLYEIIPKPGIRISKIKNLEDDIALSLSALGIRIIAPIPGKGTIGIEVPNKRKQIVSLKEVLTSDKFITGKMDLPIALGKTISNEVFVADLAKMPHLLIAGATGQGNLLVSIQY